MPDKGSKKYTIALLIAASLSVLILLVPLSSGLFDIVSVIGSTESNNNTPKKTVSVEDYDVMKNCTTDRSKKPTSIEYLTFFNCGRVSESQNGQTVREFTLIATENQSIEVMDGGYVFKAWTFNGTIPGPTMRVTEGDLVKITLVNDKNNTRSHSIHMHSIHSGEIDGVEGKGIVAPGESFTYEFVAQPFGVYPYHCHVSPVADHISRGLYGMLIIDPKEPRPQMPEMVMMMNGYDFNYDMEGPAFIPTAEEAVNNEMPDVEERDNELYSVNGKAFDYVNHPVELVAGEEYRIYLVNMLEFDLVNSIHVHGTMFEYYPSGTSKDPQQVNDIVTLSQGDRGILELSYPYPGRYMFHAHVNDFADKGWMSFFNVSGNSSSSSSSSSTAITGSSNSSSNNHHLPQQ
jgi:FtsP/CotA-like multicopper oxidase with cupredoxin domain